MESQLAERAALSESISLSQASSKSSGKKGVTLSLQEFHRGDASGIVNQYKSVSMLLLYAWFSIMIV